MGHHILVRLQVLPCSVLRFNSARRQCHVGRHKGQKPQPGWETHLTGGNRQVPWGKGSLNGAGTLEAATLQVVEGKAGGGWAGRGGRWGCVCPLSLAFGEDRGRCLAKTSTSSEAKGPGCSGFFLSGPRGGPVWHRKESRDSG